MSIQKRLANAYLWTVLGQWSVRLLGIGSTLILVRLIEPEAFGLVALATICIGFFNTLSGIGVERYLISQTDLNSQALDSAWTLNILLKLAVTVVLVALAPWLASYMDEQKLVPVIIVISINGFFASLNNIGLVKLQKNLDFKALSYLLVIVKVASTAATLIYAYFSPDHWALIVGGMVAVWIYMIGSYFIVAYRPILNFNFDREQFSFSVFILIRNILSYCRNKADTFIVSKLFTTASVGKYSIGLEFAVLPYSEVMMPAGAAIFPGLSNFKHDKVQLFDKTYKYFALVYMFVMPSIAGIWIIAPQFCPVILGDKWADTAPIMTALAVMMLPYSLTAVTNNLFDYLGKTKLSLFGDIIGLGLLVLAAAMLTFKNIEQFASMRGWVGIAAFAAILIFSRLTIGLSLRAMFSVLALPGLSAVFMLLVFHYGFTNHEITFRGLVINMLIGAMSYCLCLLFLMRVVRTRSEIWNFWYLKVDAGMKRLLPKYA